MDKIPENFEVGSRNAPVEHGDTAESKSNSTQDTYPETCIVKPKRKSQRLTTGAKQNRPRSFTRRMQHCQLCQKNFTSLFRLRKHLQSSDHKTKRKAEDCNLDKNVGAGSQKCDVCGKRKVVDCKLYKRVGASANKSDVCGKHLNSEPDLEQHLFRHNSEKCNGQNCRSEKVDTGGLQVCTCDFSTKSCTGKNDHGIHNTVSKVSCEFCNQEFFSEEMFKKHSATHMKVKVLKCDVCSKVFKTAQNLNRHLRLHTGEKPYLCSHCGQSFIQLTQLQVHLRGHSGERPYQCGYCAKTFASKFIYNQHLDIHTTGHKKYICDVCGQGFNRQSNCRRHIQLHTDSKPFKCDACGKAYSTKHALKTHKHQTLSAKSCRNSGVTPPVSMATVAVTLSNSLSIIPPFISNTFINVQTLPEK